MAWVGLARDGFPLTGHAISRAVTCFLLAELMEERVNLDNMIAWVQKRMAQNGVTSLTAPITISKPNEPQRFPRFSSDAFFRMSVPTAIKAYLNFVKQPANANDIVDGLKNGGLTTRSKNLYATVYPTLLRMKSANEVVKVDKRQWGLAEWYPARKPADDSEKKKEE